MYKELKKAWEEIVKNQAQETMTEEQKLVKRGKLWEVSVSQQRVRNFNAMSNAHAIVLSLLVTITFVGFLQPPRGWDSNHGSRLFFNSSSIKVFVVCNSLSFYSAVSGLTLYVYASLAASMGLGSVPLPRNLDDTAMNHVVEALRISLVQVALPNIQRTSHALFFFLNFALLTCVVAFTASGFAAMDDSTTNVAFVLGPFLVGVPVLVFYIYLSTTTLYHELNFDDKLRGYIWDTLKVERPVDNSFEQCRVHQLWHQRAIENV